MIHWNLVDSWRLHHPKEKSYTYFAGIHNTHHRIDFFLTSASLHPFTSRCDIDIPIIADHSAVILEYNLVKTQEGMRRWYLNISLLNEKKFIQYITQETQIYFKNNSNSSTSRLMEWEGYNAYIRGKIISFSANKAKMQRLKENNLKSSLKTLWGDMANNPSKITYERIQQQTLELNNNILAQKIGRFQGVKK